MLSPCSNQHTRVRASFQMTAQPETAKVAHLVHQVEQVSLLMSIGDQGAAAGIRGGGAVSQQPGWHTAQAWAEIY